MVQSSARNYSADESNTKTQNIQAKAAQVAEDVSQEARTLVDRVAAYTKANPVEAIAIAAGVAFVAGVAIFGPRLLQSRQKSDFDRLIRQAYREAERVRDSSSSNWSQLSDWVSKNVPNASSWR